MKEKLREIVDTLSERLAAASALKEVEDLRVWALGKKGELTQILKGMGALSPEERPAAGQIANEARVKIESMLETAASTLRIAELERRIKDEDIDITMPGRAPERGSRHPMTAVIDEMSRLFVGMGFEIAEGPEIETDYYNFVALNIPEQHPARDDQDTFYFEGNGNFMLRTATSPVQVRVMESQKPPIRIICPGKVFRSDDVDATHSPVFHQIEGLVVDKGITLGDLKGVLTVFAKEVFGDKAVVRFRPHYFPFTEPSAEMDVRCFSCGGAGCRVCKGEGWIELLGCGMVHPKVLSMSGIDPEIYSGYAFGMGLERIAMQRYGILDMRLMFENDVRFLRQFA
ncbi:MAG: phenylalanine--tRNA ligase subunit alpha [Clostridiales bacterium]|jgi:phenylalanyl-tRNA synthetase alpha chain|nr:phenylalanine--tRNA ligase subunit alpha [Clostridiales bacterium]